ncbi:MAG TPA: hypothetical protein VJ853_09280 [Thermoanaerobaculia bacterium]|nr:hypothetical protein [Thermoanaerobaculia bacterium]
MPPLTRNQKMVLGALCIAVAISRWFALSASQLDWDESLFAGGVRSYDVTEQRPHPPGYPLFILFAKMLRVATPNDYRALQAVVAIASLLLFPATFFLMRELRFGFRAAISGALITVFLPTVWYYSGTALSDIPALSAIVIASALLLAGARDPRLWIAGMFVAGIAAGIRPMHVIIAIVPAVIGARKAKTILIGGAVFTLVVIASYLGAALATSNPPWGYIHQLGVTAHHIGTVDSFNNATRLPLQKLAGKFFIGVLAGGRAGLAVLALAIVGLIAGAIRRSAAIAIILAMFVPIAIISWMMLDQSAVTRYGLAYVMLYSLLAAYGIDVIARGLTPVVATILIVAMIAWTAPALAIVHRQPSPPVAAMRWVRAHVPDNALHLYLDAPLGYHADYLLADYPRRLFANYDEIPPAAYVPGNYCLINRLTLQPHVLYFSFPRKRLPQIARDTYFETSIVPMETMIRFGDGWYQDEWDDERTHAWKWMGETSTTLFPPLNGAGVLDLHFHLPLDALPHPTKVQIIWNGSTLDQFVSKDLENARRYVLPSRTSPNECRIVIDQAAHAPGDPRDLGLELYGVSWEPTQR